MQRPHPSPHCNSTTLGHREHLTHGRCLPYTRHNEFRLYTEAHILAIFFTCKKMLHAGGGDASPSSPPLYPPLLSAVCSSKSVGRRDGTTCECCTGTGHGQAKHVSLARCWRDLTYDPVALRALYGTKLGQWGVGLETKVKSQARNSAQ